MELMKQNHLLKIGFVIFLKGAPFWDFVDYRLLNYMPSGIQICIPLFWGNFSQLGSSLIKQCVVDCKNVDVLWSHVRPCFIKVLQNNKNGKEIILLLSKR